jgi:hypothetical protein
VPPISTAPTPSSTTMLQPSTGAGEASTAAAVEDVVEDDDEPQLPVHERLGRLSQLPVDTAISWDEGRGSAEDVAGELGRRLSSGSVQHLTLGTTDARGASRLGSVPARQHERWPTIALAPFRRPDARSILALRLSGLPLASDDALSPLSELSSLRSLRVEHSPSLPTPALAKLIKLIRLELVSLRSCASIGDQAPGFLLSSQRLKALHLDGTSITDIALLSATVFPLLARLHFSYTAVTDLGLTLLSKRAPALTDVSAAGCDAVTDAGLLALSVLPRLRRVDMSSCARVSPSALELFAAERPGCSLGPANDSAVTARLALASAPDRHTVNGSDGRAVNSVDRLAVNSYMAVSSSDRHAVNSSARLTDFMVLAHSDRRHGGPGHSCGGGGAAGAAADPRRRPADAQPPPHNAAQPPHNVAGAGHSCHGGGAAYTAAGPRRRPADARPPPPPHDVAEARPAHDLNGGAGRAPPVHSLSDPRLAKDPRLQHLPSPDDPRLGRDPRIQQHSPDPRMQQHTPDSRIQQHSTPPDPRMQQHSPDRRAQQHPASQPHGLSQDTLAAIAALRPPHRHR